METALTSGLVSFAVLRKTNAVRKAVSMVSTNNIAYVVGDVVEFGAGLYLSRRESNVVKGIGVGMMFDGVIDVVDRFVPQL